MSLLGAVRLGAGEPAAGDPAAHLAATRLVSIGPVTSATLRELGLPVAVEAAVYTAAGLVAAVVADAVTPCQG